MAYIWCNFWNDLKITAMALTIFKKLINIPSIYIKKRSILNEYYEFRPIDRNTTVSNMSQLLIDLQMELLLKFMEVRVKMCCRCLPELIIVINLLTWQRCDTVVTESQIWDTKTFRFSKKWRKNRRNIWTRNELNKLHQK